MRVSAPMGSPAAWEGATADMTGMSLLQSSAYGESRAHQRGWSVERGFLADGSAVAGACQAMVRRLPGGRGGLIWLNRAPLWCAGGEGPDPEMARRMLSCLRRHFVDERGMYLRVAPAWRDASVPESVYRESGFTVTSVHGWASAVVDLGRTADDLRAALHGKWRNALTRAEKDTAIATHRHMDEAGMALFLGGYAAHLGTRDYATNLDPAFVQRLQAALADDQKMTFLTAERSGQLLGGVAIAWFGATAEYLAGFNTESGRHHRTPQE